ncbi:hypothetical protein B0H19DRAFT_1250857 [Mycena capillaripes]|nr:hypothetical protein B0H19DRAFT_1250857 [Mycena capillaripes]
MSRLDELLTSNLDEAFFGKVDLGSLLLELAEGCLRIIGKHGDDWSPQTLHQVAQGWGFFLKSCPPSPELPQHLSDIATISIVEFAQPENLHNAVQWLKKHDASSLDYLEKT